MSDSAGETPTPLALLLADHVYHDRATGKWVIAGVFSSIGLTTVPRNYDYFEVFFQVTNVSRPVELRLCIEHADGESVLLDVGGPINAKSPLDVIARRVVVRNLSFKKTGKHWVMLKSGQEILIEVPLHIVRIKGQQQQQQGGGSPMEPE